MAPSKTKTCFAVQFRNLLVDSNILQLPFKDIPG